MTGLEEGLDRITAKWIARMKDSLVALAGESYSAGMFHASTQLKTGLSFKVAEKEALEYAEAYGKKLVDTGTIEVTQYVKDEAGKVIGFETKEIEWLGNKAVGTRNSLADIIKKGIEEGRPTGLRISETGKYPKGSIAAELQDQFSDYKGQAANIARTETTKCYYKGEVNRYAKAGVAYVQRLGDEATACDICKPLIGLIYPLGSQPPLPTHVNCFLPGTRYKPAGDIVSGIWGDYSGKVIVINTVSGKSVSVTPNHLFLTPHGFCVADILNAGDDIICCSGFERESGTINPDNDREIPTVEQIIESLPVSSKMITTSVPASPKDLHNDGGSINGDIHIINANGFLGRNRESSFLQHVGKDLLCPGIEPSFALLGDGSLDSFVDATFSAFNGLVSGSRETSAFFSGRIRHTDIHGFALSSRLEPDTNHAVCNGFACDASIFSDLLNRFAGLVTLDQIKNIKVESYHGKVYDFQTTSSLSMAEGFVTSNCRCDYRPYFPAVGETFTTAEGERMVFTGTEYLNITAAEE